MKMHPLPDGHPLPERLNNPFDYTPHPLCQQAAKEVQAYISSVPQWQEELAKGKMFGVLVVKAPNDTIGYLAAYSGLLDNRNDWPFFVPPVFDFQQPDGYFKQEESCISAINKQVEEIKQSETLQSAMAQTIRLQNNAKTIVEHYRNEMEQSKRRRDDIRSQYGKEPLPTVVEEQLIRESQFMKAELRRIKRHQEQLISEAEAETERVLAPMHALLKERRQRSDALQKWLFDHFIMLNARGEEKSLTRIFADTLSCMPPAGAGECCAPKLLQAAYQHQLRPLCMAEFWWGGSPDGEIRHHGYYYPACKNKCRPILQFMLQGLEVDMPSPLANTSLLPTVCYEDQDIVVVEKPAGLLTVPGKDTSHSVEQFILERHPKAERPVIVHRLDMDTSGLLIAALNRKAYVHLQRQFLTHNIEKAYIALLDGHLPPSLPREGNISLPLAPDWDNRPRQKVDFNKGKEANTHYKVIEERESYTRIFLFPTTGRTHQLRVHCAHKKGLATPIKGDRLYGTPCDRLYLQACRIIITHPTTGERMTFAAKADF